MAKSDFCAEKPKLPVGCSDAVQGVLDLAGCIPVVGDAAHDAICKAVGNIGNVLLRTMPALIPLMGQLSEQLENQKPPKHAVKKAEQMKAFSCPIKGKVKTGAKKANGASSRGKRIKQAKREQKAACTNGKCFTGDTLVLTKSGFCPIKQIQKGDDLYSRDEYTKKIGFQKVEEVFQTEAHTIYKIRLQGGQEIHTTAYHPFFIEGKGWVNAIRLREGDWMDTMEKAEPITGITKTRQEEPVAVYNLQVAQWSSYFVTKQQIYVHNSEGEHAEKQYRVSEKRKKHILEGESADDPGHGPNRGFERSAFPDSMTDDEAIATVEDVANSPNAAWVRRTGPGEKQVHIGGPAPGEPKFTKSGAPVRYNVTEERNGLKMLVAVEPDGEGIITGFPTG